MAWGAGTFRAGPDVARKGGGSRRGGGAAPPHALRGPRGFHRRFHREPGNRL